MVLLVFFLFVIYGVFHRAVDLTAAFQNAPDLLLAVMQRFQMEAVIVAGVHRIQNGDQTADASSTVGRSSPYSVASMRLSRYSQPPISK